jgi:hypothetical protein
MWQQTAIAEQIDWQNKTKEINTIYLLHDQVVYFGSQAPSFSKPARLMGPASASLTEVLHQRDLV